MNRWVARYIGKAPAIGTSLTARIYLDHAATTPPAAAVRAAVAMALECWANPSSPHAEGRRARAMLEEARAGIAAAHGWTGEVLLTSGASESLAIGLGRARADARIVATVEHDAVMRLCGPTTAMQTVDARGLIDPAALSASLARGERALVAVQWANSETGVRQPIAEIAAAVHAAGALLLVDAAQMPTVCAGDVTPYADLVALSAHKHGGPPGVGALLVRDLAMLTPTGGQERGYRPGTENLPGALGWAAALVEPEPIERWVALRARLEDAIRRSGGEIVAADAPRHPAVGSYRLPGVAATTQLIRLDLAGFAVSAGSACASGSMKPSHVLAAMGWDEGASREVIRVSFGRATNKAEIDAFVGAWRDLARATRRFAA